LLDGNARQFSNDEHQLSERFTQLREGDAILFIPAEALTKKVPPKTPAFFNPAAKLSRDVSILVYNSFMNLNHFLFIKEPVTLADTFSGVGARSIRVAMEVPTVEKVVLNDINPIALSVARKSAKINGVEEKCLFSQKDVHVFLNDRRSYKKERFVIVDLDPFGSPSPYADSLVRAVVDGGLVSVTATDTAVLYGKYPEVCFRKYYSKPINHTYSNEIAVRILVSFLALVAGRMDLSIEPIFSHSHHHYSRVYVRVHASSNEANKLADNLGYVTHCFKCGDRRKHPFSFPSITCDICNNKLNIAGPLWIKPIFDRQLISGILGSNNNNILVERNLIANQHNVPSLDNHNNNDFDKKGSPSSDVVMNGAHCRQISHLLHRALLELDELPYYYTLDEIGSVMKTSPPSMENIIEMILRVGFQISRTSFRPTGFKTNASMKEIKNLLS
jgi:tRNA (guanine26-N2/guanine27-N2)-dimethyltransferase